MFIEAKDDGSGGDSWCYKSCKAPIRSSPPTNQHPVFYRPDALPVAQSAVSKHWRENITFHGLATSSLGVFQLCIWPLIAPGYLGEGCHASLQLSDVSTPTGNELYRRETNFGRLPHIQPHTVWFDKSGGNNWFLGMEDSAGLTTPTHQWFWVCFDVVMDMRTAECPSILKQQQQQQLQCVFIGYWDLRALRKKQTRVGIKLELGIFCK